MQTADSSVIHPTLTATMPPRVLGIPLLGALPELLLRHHAALDRWFAAHGDFFEVPIAGIPVKFIASGHLASKALLSNRGNFVRSPIFNDGVKMVMGDSVLTREGDAWLERRRILQPKFRARVMLGMASRINASLDTVIDSLEPGRIDLARLCDRITMGIGLQVMFGRTMTEEVFEELSVLSPLLIGRISFGWVTTKLPSWLPMPGERRFRRAMARIDEIILGMVQERRESGDLGDDLLGTLLHMADEGLLSDQGIRDEAVTMFIAGYETTSNSLSWTLHTLAGRPEITAEIRREAEEVFGGEGEADVRKLGLSRRAFQEGLRVHPAAMWVIRLATKDTDLGEHLVRAGETIVCSTHLIHRNPKDWVDPDHYDPERFSSPIPDHAYIPFGLGPKMCIGKHLALLEGQLALAKFFRRWSLSPVTDHTPRKRIRTTLGNADGIFAELSPAP